MSSSLPSYQGDTSSFSAFPNLPTEIRWAIWDIEASTPQIVDLTITTRRIQIKPHAFLYVCRESRRLFLQHHPHGLALIPDRLVLQTNGPVPQAHVHFSRDTFRIRVDTSKTQGLPLFSGILAMEKILARRFN